MIRNRQADIRKPIVVNSRVEHVRYGVFGTCKGRRVLQRITRVLIKWDNLSEAMWVPLKWVRNCESSTLTG